MSDEDESEHEIRRRQEGQPNVEDDEDDDLNEEEVKDRLKDLSAEVKDVVGDIFPMNGNNVVTPYRLFTGEFAQVHYVRTVLNPYVASRCEGKTKAERDAFKAKLLKVLEALRIPMNKLAKILIQRKILLYAKRAGMMVYSRKEPVATYKDVIRSWTQDERNHNYRKLWMALYGGFELEYGWEAVLAECVKTQCHIEYQESDEDIQAERTRRRGPPLKTGIEKVVTHQKSELVRAIVQKGRKSHGRFFHVKGLRGTKSAPHKKGVFPEALLNEEDIQMTDERNEYWVMEEQRALERPLQREDKSPKKGRRSTSPRRAERSEPVSMPYNRDAPRYK